MRLCGIRYVHRNKARAVLFSSIYGQSGDEYLTVYNDKTAVVIKYTVSLAFQCIPSALRERILIHCQIDLRSSLRENCIMFRVIEEDIVHY